jgi:uncharacterized membrane protein
VGVSPEGQLAFLLQHPWQIVVVLARQLVDLFGTNGLTGGWISVYGVLGWAELPLRSSAYAWLLLATVLAVLADVRSSAPATEFGGQQLGGRLGLVVERVVPAVSFVLIVPAIATVLYFIFSPVGSASIRGMQGRYLQLPYFSALTLVIMWMRRNHRLQAPLGRVGRVAGRLAPWICMLLTMVGTREAFRAIFARYYEIQ